MRTAKFWSIRIETYPGDGNKGEIVKVRLEVVPGLDTREKVMAELLRSYAALGVPVRIDVSRVPQWVAGEFKPGEILDGSGLLGQSLN